MSFPGNELNNTPAQVPAATEVWGILGGPGIVDAHGDTGRISHEEAEALRARIRGELEPHVQTVAEENSFLHGETINRRVAIPPAELADRYDTGLQICALGLANNTLRNRDVSKLTTIAETLSAGWVEEGRQVNVVDPLRHKADAVTRFACSVAMLEGNFPPNEEGSRLDQIVGLARRSGFVHDNLEHAYDILHAIPDLFGDMDTTKMIADGVVDRLEQRHPKLAGIQIGNPFPHFA